MSITSRSNLRHRAARRAAVALTVAAALAAAVRAQLPPPPEPTGNPSTTAKENLGKVLFWDEQISSTRTVACGTCHLPEVGGEDPRSGVDPLAVHPGPDGVFGTEDDVFGSPGVPQNTSDGLYQWNTHFGLLPQVTGRRTVSSINAGYSPELFWDGRAPEEFVDPVTQVVVPGLETGAALESQAVGPPVSDVEMGDVGRVWAEVLARIGASEPLALSPEVPTDLIAWIAGRSYAALFDEAFGDSAITAPRVAMAIASYERTQFTAETPFDVWQSGGPPLTPQEDAGFDVFFNAGLCKNCHDPNPPFLFTDNTFRYTGVTPQTDDPGRMDVTADPADEGKMRVPMLRNLELRAPFMHNGKLATLEDVIEFYDQGGFHDGPNKDPLIVPLGLTQQEKADLLAFLTRPLTDPRLEEGVFPFDRPTLYTESSRAPTLEGAGQPGSGALVPEVVALEPPLIGNPSFTVGVWNGLGGADAWLVIDDEDPGLVLPADVGQFAFEMISLDGAGVGNGFGSVSLAIPDEAALDGAEWFGRWYVDDTGGGFDVAVSKLLRFRTFGVQQQTAVFADGFESGDTSAWSATVP
jgi:cytochrome c peroxidase